jgi:thiol-disulfide isomerase/thioredoxin
VSPGIAILLGALVVFGGMIGMQWWMASKMRANEGKAAPPLGDLGDPEGRVVWFYGPNCGPCHAMRPAVDALGEQAILIDVSRHMDVARAYGVLATPTTVLVRGGRIAAVRPGRLSPGQLDDLLAA